MSHITKWLDARPSLAAALAGALLFLGAAAGCPVSGMVAVFPVSFCLFVAAFFLKGNLLFQGVLTAVFSLGCGFARGVSAPFVYGGAMLLLALAAAGLVACLKRVKQKKLFWIFALLAALPGVILPLFLYGTPGAYLAAGARARAYLADRYPDQEFTAAESYRDPVLGVWHCDCSYLNEDNVLTSVILFGDTVEDGFLADRMAFSQEVRRSALIEALRDGKEEILTEPDGFSEELASREVVPGVYGKYDQTLEKEMRFSLTFRREKAQKQAFALAIRDTMDLLREKDLSYDALRFTAISAGAPVYECTVTGETAPEELMDLIRRI
ncbi:MAG: hypothetical protein J6Z79_02285 [Clostridia bacterium]|nr:hypothetical protein [Clostridia bacterium]